MFQGRRTWQALRDWPQITFALAFITRHRKALREDKVQNVYMYSCKCWTMNRKNISVVLKYLKTYIFKVIKMIAFSHIIMSRNVKIFQFIILVNFNFLGILRSSLQNVKFEPTFWICRFNHLLIRNLWNKNKLLTSLLRDENCLWIEVSEKAGISPDW